MASTTVWLARHGETIWTVEDKFNGLSEVELTERGRTQAEELGKWLEKEPLSAVYCSPLQRCIETAGLAVAHRGLSPIITPELKELDYGLWDGMRREEIISSYAELWKEWTRDPAAVAAPQGETGYDVLARVMPAIKRLVTKHAGESILVVAHKAVNRLVLCDLLGVPPRDYRRRIGQSACALNCIKWLNEEPFVVLVNSTAHYHAL